MQRLDRGPQVNQTQDFSEYTWSVAIDALERRFFDVRALDRQLVLQLTLLAYMLFE